MKREGFRVRTDKKGHDSKVVEHTSIGLANCIRLECKKCGKVASGQGAGYLFAHLDAILRLDGFKCEKNE